MCGRYTLTTTGEQLAEEFDLIDVPPVTPRYNVAPTQMVPVVRMYAEDAPARRLDQLKWGLIPHWAREAGIGSRMINARSEEAANKPAFRTPLRRQRCLVPCTGFFEWQAADPGIKSAKKQPYYIHRRDDHPLGFAGLWDRWHDPDGNVIESFTILTTSPSELMRPLHNRMPVIIPRAEYALWLDPQVQDPARLAHLLAPFTDDALIARPVSTRVNNVRFDDPGCIAAAN